MSSGSLAVTPALDSARTRTARRVFLSARWHALAMLNWEVDPALVAPLAPRGTEIDFHAGKTYVSLVGFLFLDTRLLGLPIPGHRHFEEVNLRIYVRRLAGGEVRRGVTFIKEIVPRWAIAQTARWCYNEPYVALPMRHQISGPLARVQGSGFRIQPVGCISAAQCTTDKSEESVGGTIAAQCTADNDNGRVAYEWKHAGRWHSLAVSYSGPPQPLVRNSHEEFIAEHYWGYCRQRDGGTVEYQVEHPPWNVWRASQTQLDIDAAALCGPPFGDVLAQPPTTILLADGSPVEVMKPERV
jgi:uncharacterized protein